MTGKDGVLDPGENRVEVSVKGTEAAVLKIPSYYFEKLNAANIPMHYMDSNIGEHEMRINKISVFGKELEAICCFKAAVVSFTGRLHISKKAQRCRLMWK